MEEKNKTKNIKEIIIIIAITYFVVTIISGLIWFWFSGNLNFFGGQGTHYDIMDFYTGCFGSFLFFCPFASCICLLITKHWKASLGFIGLGLINLLMIYGVGILD